MKHVYCTVQNTKIVTFCIIMLLFTSVLKAQVPILSFQPIITSGLANTVEITNPKDGSGRLFVVQQNGIIRMLKGGVLQSAVFLNIADTISYSGERGLLSLAFHPNYKQNRYFFLYYTNKAGDITVARYRTFAADSNKADPNSGVVLMKIPKPYANHNGGQLQFGPDGFLYFGTGDGGSGGDPNNFAQSRKSLLGKMLRINVDSINTSPYYSIPASNPYVNDTSVLKEIYAFGLRNPWRWSIDSVTNKVWIADVGQDKCEEVNANTLAEMSGLNYGWRCYEGDSAYNLASCLPKNNYAAPVFSYSHSLAVGGKSITGGFVYRGSAWPSLYGYYICADFVTGNAWLVKEDSTGKFVGTLQKGGPTLFSTFGEDDNRELYAAKLNGTIYSVKVSVPLPLANPILRGMDYGDYHQLVCKITGTTPTQVSIEYSEFGEVFTKPSDNLDIHQIGNVYTFIHRFNNAYRELYYRIKIVQPNGEINYSNVVKLTVAGSDPDIKVYPTVINNHLLNIESKHPLTGIQLYNSSGQILFRSSFKGMDNKKSVVLPSNIKGIYWVEVKSNAGKKATKKILLGN